MAKDLRVAMARHHEDYLARVLKGQRSRGSGNQQSGQMDGRQDAHRTPDALAWDAKATRQGSIGVSRAMWEKAIEQSHYEKPVIPLRFYADDRLSDRPEDGTIDLIVLSLPDFLEMRERQRPSVELSRTFLEAVTDALESENIKVTEPMVNHVAAFLVDWLGQTRTVLTGDGLRRLR